MVEVFGMVCARCPACGRGTLKRETEELYTVVLEEESEECSECGYFHPPSAPHWPDDASGSARSEECSECGYFHQTITNLAGLAEPLLRAMHFRTDTYPYVREGFIRKTTATRGQYHGVSSAVLSALDVDWVDWREPEDRLGGQDVRACVRTILRFYEEAREGLSSAEHAAESSARECLGEIQEVLDSLDLQLGGRQEEAPLTTPAGDETSEVRQMQRLAQLRRRVERFELSVRTRNCLRNAQIETLGQLVQKTADELPHIRNFGRKSLREVEELLASLDLQLGMRLDKETLTALADAELLKRLPLLTKYRLRVTDLDISATTAHVLRQAQISTVGDLVQQSKSALLQHVYTFLQESLHHELRAIARLAEVALRGRADGDL